MFFNKKSKQNVTHAYVCEIKGISSLVVDIKNCLENEPAYFSINYGKNICFKKNFQKMSKFDDCDIEHLDIFNESGSLMFNLRRVFSYMEFDKNVYQITFVRKFDSSFETEIYFFRLCRKNCQILYGYTQFLGENHIPTTESEIKRGLFGGVSSKSVREETKWILNPKDIFSGAIKGFYPLNYLNDESLKSAQNFSDNVLHGDHRKDNLLVIDVISLQKLACMPSIQNYVHL
jgi:hypothetical protein